VQLVSGPRVMSPSVATLIDLEGRLGLDRPEIFKAFAAKIEDMKAQLLTLLGDLNAQGKTIAGYGASHTVTALTYQFELGDLLSFLVDDNPRKQNLFSPGYHIPVFSSQAIYERRPDYVLILAWNYSHPIMKKHQAYLDQGGHFIIPLPKVDVI